MKNEVITTKHNLLQALAPLVSKDIEKQRLWLQEEDLPSGFEYLDSTYDFGFESDVKWNEESTGRGYVVAPAFMVAVVDTCFAEDNELGIERTISDVYFESSVETVEDIILELSTEVSIRRGDIHLFMFHTYPNTGYIEIPFNVGYYIKDKEPSFDVKIENYKEVSTEGPRKTLFNWYDSLAVGSFSKPEGVAVETFVEIPGVFDAEYNGCPCCGERAHELFVRENLADCFELAAIRTNSAEDDLEFVIKSRWYDYKLLIDFDLVEDVDTSPEFVGFGGFYIDDLMKAVKIQTMKKF